MSSLIPGISVLVDPSGNYGTQTVGAVPATTNASGATTSTYSGVLATGLGPTGLVTPVTVDAVGGLQTRNVLVPTMTFAPINVINTTASSGKSMISVYNASAATMYQRVIGFWAMCPPQAGTSSGLFGTSSYTTVGMAAFVFTTAHTGGTVIAGANHDARDAYDTTNFTCRTGATIAGQASSALCVFDAAYSSIYGYAQRQDMAAKLWVIPPSSGITFNCLSSVGSSGVNFYLRLMTVQNVT